MPVDDSRTERRREYARAYSERRRREAGVVPVKGVPFPCSVCGMEYVRQVKHSKRCPACQAAFYVQRTRLESEKRRADPERRAIQNEWAKRHRAKSARLRVSCHMRVLVHRAIGRGKAGRSWRAFVDYSLEELMAHLERQFLPGMTWENQGEWHIDHIVPQASFQYEGPADEGFRQCWSLTNLRPLWGRDNVRKNARRTHLI